jgi:pimeloyl-ACP methyl ester carboxylesterase
MLPCPSRLRYQAEPLPCGHAGATLGGVSETAEARGWALHGPQGAPVFVLLHGVFFDRAMWLPVVERLAVRARVLTIDLPGHGDLADEPFTLDAATARVRTVLAETDTSAHALVGLSLGGYVAMALVGKSPGLCPILVITGSTREPRAFLGGPFRGLFRLLSRLPNRLMAPVARFALAFTTPAEVAATLRRSRFSGAGGFRALSEIPAGGFREALSAFEGSVHIVNGARDPIAVPGQVAFLAAARSGRLSVLEGVGHLAPIQAPDAFASLLLASLPDAR